MQSAFVVQVQVPRVTFNPHHLAQHGRPVVGLDGKGPIPSQPPAIPLTTQDPVTYQLISAVPGPGRAGRAAVSHSADANAPSRRPRSRAACRRRALVDAASLLRRARRRTASPRRCCARGLPWGEFIVSPNSGAPACEGRRPVLICSRATRPQAGPQTFPKSKTPACEGRRPVLICSRATRPQAGPQTFPKKQNAGL